MFHYRINAFFSLICIILLPLLLLSTPVPDGNKIKVSSCSSDDYDEDGDALIKNLKVKLTPDPPEAGKSLTVHVEAKLTDEISSKASLEVDLAGVIKKSFPLCEVAKLAKVPCPLKEGKFDAKITIMVPNTPLPIAVPAKIRVLEGGEELICRQASVKIAGQGNQAQDALSLVKGVIGNIFG